MHEVREDTTTTRAFDALERVARSLDDASIACASRGVRTTLRACATALRALNTGQRADAETLCVEAIEHTERAHRALVGAIERGDAVDVAEAVRAASEEGEEKWARGRRRAAAAEAAAAARRAVRRREEIIRANVGDGADARGFRAFYEAYVDGAGARAADGAVAAAARRALLFADGAEILEAEIRDASSGGEAVEMLAFAMRHVGAFAAYEAERGDAAAAAVVAARAPALTAQYATWLKDAAVASRDARALSTAYAALLRCVSESARLVDVGDVAGAANASCAAFNALSVVLSVAGALDDDERETLRATARACADAVAAAVERTADEGWTEARFGVGVQRLALERLLGEIDRGETREN